MPSRRPTKFVLCILAFALELCLAGCEMRTQYEEKPQVLVAGANGTIRFYLVNKSPKFPKAEVTARLLEYGKYYQFFDGTLEFGDGHNVTELIFDNIPDGRHRLVIEEHKSKTALECDIDVARQPGSVFVITFMGDPEDEDVRYPHFRVELKEAPFDPKFI
jgi:hypothetical protein